MPHPQLNRKLLNIKKLNDRPNKVVIEKDFIPLIKDYPEYDGYAKDVFQETVEYIIKAKKNNKPVMLVFGAHSIKNGLSLVMQSLMQNNWLTLLATNGAGVIHDWEFSFQGQSSEDVKANVEKGQFGIWQETGFYINLALVVGAYEGLGYGESIGSLIFNEGLNIPDVGSLENYVNKNLKIDYAKSAAAIDLISKINEFNLPSGFMKVSHPYKKFSAQAKAFELKIPFTAHPMIGHDIIYNHPMNHGASIGRAAERDFLIYANQVQDLDGGVYLSIGSAVMSPMVFEKSLSMAQNLEIQKGRRIKNHYLLVADLAESKWDWKKGEPPATDPAYYLRYCKTFSRMGGTMNYITTDNGRFLTLLARALGCK